MGDMEVGISNREDKVTPICLHQLNLKGLLTLLSMYLCGFLIGHS